MDKDDTYNRAMYNITADKTRQMQDAIDSIKHTAKRYGIVVECVELRDSLTGKVVRAGRKYGHKDQTRK